MPTYSPRYRLCKLRKDAIKRGVTDGSVCPRQVFGSLTGNVDSTGKGRLENVLALSRNSFVRGLILSGVSPVLHPRPREIYGDPYAPALIMEAQGRSVLETNNASRISRPRPLRTRTKKCGVCASGRLGGCVRYLTSQIGPALALEELVVRAIQPRPTQKKYSLGLRKMPPGPSPLSEPISFNDCEKLAYSVKASGMRTPRGGSTSVPVPMSLRKVPAHRIQGMKVANSRRLVHEVRSTVSATHEHVHSVDTDSKPNSKERVISHVQGPIPAGSDGDGRIAAARNRYLNSRKDQPLVKDKPGFAPRKTSRVQHPVSSQSSIPFPTTQSDQLDRASPVGSGKGWRKLRSMGSALIKKKLVQGMAF
ncbi:uncharacterized protein FOMMEDRAFT_138365 [Fomitiporia mediterranea MF3/22]|uniref:uncharacterized protein n=1 Tax=Fomitiporia mediterranea (strain MF3/22) TaxID=694068 RepID=UPI0004408FBC|nr:uncharacterized protein FOMMEDRAFT_138365 [Fomitiporia mediterranea MF3/22]EJD06344.1 hypothetical protein FOMMEDRAFT_138365 [Fomitiporia mediterranea MF3/22]